MRERAIPEAVVSARARSRVPAFGFAKTLITKKPLGAFGAFLVIAMVLLAVFAEPLSPYDFAESALLDKLQGPSLAHWLGTDELGRDLWTRILFGAKVSMQVGILVVIFATLVAIFIGAFSGFAGGWWDLILLRIVDGFMAIPLLLIAIVFVGIFGAGMFNIIAILSVASGIGQSRVLRSGVIAIKEQQYIEASRAIGCSSLRIFIRHILPNVSPIIIVLMSTALGGVILAESSLSFLGYGIPPPQPTWGGMLAGRGMAYMQINPWMAVWPGLFLSLTVFGANMFGDALRDLLDPRLRGSR